MQGNLIETVRPILTYLITLVYNALLIYGTVTGKLDYKEFMNQAGPVNALLLGFWFGERSALVDPKKDS